MLWNIIIIIYLFFIILTEIFILFKKKGYVLNCFITIYNYLL